MNEEIHCISNKEKRKKQQMNRKMMTKTVLKFYTMHIKNLILFPYVLVDLFRQR